MVRFILRLFILVALLLIAGLIYAIWPRTGDLRGFDPDAVARLETGMWRDYYTHDHQALAAKLYSLYRDQYHFSPSDAAQLAYYSGKAAQLFQPTANRDEAQVALPLLVSHYTVIRNQAGEKFDPIKVAKMELDWWQQRREQAPPEDYGAVVAQVTEEIFQAHNEHVTKAGLQRAAMMRYCDDRRDGRMQAADWAHIEEQLIESYRELKTGVARIR